MKELNSGLRFTDEEKFLFLCISKKLNAENIEEINKLVQKGLKWDLIINLASKNHLNSLLYWQINKIQLTGIPSEKLVQLRENFNFNAKKNMLFFGELLKIVKLLESENVFVLPYKGPILAFEGYCNIAIREFDDLDLFIYEKDVPSVVQMLTSNSYESYTDLRLVKERKFIDTQRELKFINKEKSISVEIHWSFQGLFFSLDDIDINKNVIKKNFNGFLINTLSIEDLILVLSIHNACHRWTRISWICDLQWLIESKNIKWTEIINKANKLSIQKVLYINLALCNILFGLEIPNLLKIKCADNDTSSLIDKTIRRLLNSEYKPLSLYEELFYSYKLRDNSIHGIKDIIKGFTNPTIYEWMTLCIPSCLWPIYYIYRPINLLWRHKWK